MPLVGGGFAKVIKTEEKGSDVNLATHLLVDAFTNAFELAVIISNDSDLLGPIRVVSERLGKQIGLLNPQKHVSVTLAPHVRFVKHIRAGVLAKCQFPQVVYDVNGSFSKPMGW